jgi:hypothetical protein
MIRPVPGELLAGICEALHGTVLPVLADGDARRQLKAALHVLGRLQRSWETVPAAIAQDNEDMARTLESVLVALRAGDGSSDPFVASLRGALTSVCAAPATSTTPAALNLELQALLESLDDWLHLSSRRDSDVCVTQLAVLEGLFRRMVEREVVANGLPAEGA